MGSSLVLLLHRKKNEDKGEIFPHIIPGGRREKKRKGIN
jgi:hypothetical protein